MEAILSGMVAERRFLMLMVGAYALMALAIGAIGIFGVLANQVAQRRTELGVRSVLGATPRGLILMVLSRAGRLAVLGVAAGIVISLLTSRLLVSQLYGVSPHDPLLLAGISGINCRDDTHGQFHPRMPRGES